MEFLSKLIELIAAASPILFALAAVGAAATTSYYFRRERRRLLKAEQLAKKAQTFDVQVGGTVRVSGDLEIRVLRGGDPVQIVVREAEEVGAPPSSFPEKVAEYLGNVDVVGEDKRVRSAGS